MGSSALPLAPSPGGMAGLCVTGWCCEVNEKMLFGMLLAWHHWEGEKREIWGNFQARALFWQDKAWCLDHGTVIPLFGRGICAVAIRERCLCNTTKGWCFVPDMFRDSSHHLLFSGKRNQIWFCCCHLEPYSTLKTPLMLHLSLKPVLLWEQNSMAQKRLF